MAQLRLNHMSLQVRSLEDSVRFYRDVLQLPEIECRAGKAHIRWFGLGDGQSVHLIEGDVGKTFVKRSTHFCISSGDFEGTLLHLRDRGAAFCNLAGEPGQEHRRADGVRSVYLQDPDGYWLEINEDF
jgi:lactoylglutathione lyase